MWEKNNNADRFNQVYTMLLCILDFTCIALSSSVSYYRDYYHTFIAYILDHNVSYYHMCALHSVSYVMCSTYPFLFDISPKSTRYSKSVCICFFTHDYPCMISYLC